MALLRPLQGLPHPAGLLSDASAAAKHASTLCGGAGAARHHLAQKSRSQVAAVKPKTEEPNALDAGPDRSGADAFGGLTVGQVLAPGLCCKLLLDYELGDAAEALSVSGQTAAAVCDEHGQVVGLLTENDIMRAFFEGASPDTRLSEWLAGGMARAPDPMLHDKLMARPTDTLAEVAERMVANAISGDCASHHLLVQNPEGGPVGVLSSHDLVRALCKPEMWANAYFHHTETTPEGKHAAKPMTVRSIMKPREDVFTCSGASTLKDVVKVLLVTQQNSALIVGEEGEHIYGIVTPQDFVRAFYDGVSNDENVADWLGETRAGPLDEDSADWVDKVRFGPEAPTISSDASLVDAAAAMTDGEVDHLVVVLPGTTLAAGTLSSLDLILQARARAPVLRPSAVQQGAGPTVGEVVTQYDHLTAVCDIGATLRDAAQLLDRYDRTSAAVLMADAEGGVDLLTDEDIMRAYVEGLSGDASAESYLKGRTSATFLMVKSTTKLTEAASLMSGSAASGRNLARTPCHHLVVSYGTSAEQGWLGTFSALDVARGLCRLDTELDIAKVGADDVTVSKVMKPLSTLPMCKLSDTLKHAITLLLNSRQQAVLVFDENGAYYGVITPRCAVQALARDVPGDSGVAVWLRRMEAEMPRQVAPETALLEAAQVMTTYNVHHLVVKDPYAEPAAAPVGVLSSLDLARGMASMYCHSPFVSLGWLWLCRGPGACMLQSE
ncbi:unnamed protein product [Polarella glacialis]|uniref:CBS domain-containing protein n=1 Tax=Polarella glacialis TaxID=89957 RepID=A0A813GF37_POLGL|nr:unnamed protein product [Polarella glacialis]